MEAAATVEGGLEAAVALGWEVTAKEAGAKEGWVAPGWEARAMVEGGLEAAVAPGWEVTAKEAGAKEGWVAPGWEARAMVEGGSAGQGSAVTAMEVSGWAEGLGAVGWVGTERAAATVAAGWAAAAR